MDGEFRVVELKLEEARAALAELDEDEPPATFQRHLHAFLISARSTLQVMRFQFGFYDLRKAEKAVLAPAERAARKAFDTWFQNDPTMQAAWMHSLAEQRDTTIHRTGQAQVEHDAPHAAGVTVRRGTAVRRPLVLVFDERTAMPLEQQPLGGGPLGARHLKVGISLLGGGRRYVFPLPKGDEDVRTACESYLRLLDTAVAGARSGRP